MNSAGRSQQKILTELLLNNNMFQSVKEDLELLKTKFGLNPVAAFLTNRGFHALLCYRISNKLFLNKIPVVPLFLTRMIQICYAIDIDYKARLSGGIVIIHGVGLVIGQDAIVSSNTIIYHGVTLGRKRQNKHLDDLDGYPIVGRSCVLGAGCKLIGNIHIGDNCIIGPNVVLTRNIQANSVVKCPEPIISVRNT